MILSRTRLYRIFDHMKQRCYNKHNTRYKDYGGRGIEVCNEWCNNFQVFSDWSMSNGYKEDLTIDRIDVNGNYEPSNCRWVDNVTQQNNKRNSVYLTYNGKSQTMAQWSRELGINRHTLNKRHQRGYTDTECLFGRVKQCHHGTMN